LHSTRARAYGDPALENNFLARPSRSPKVCENNSPASVVARAGVKRLLTEQQSELRRSLRAGYGRKEQE
jgi:hypothetical protein